jgi:hypothetical protein
MRNATHATFQNKLAAAVGTDPSRVAVQCVHQHTAMSVDSGAQELLNEFRDDPPQRIDLQFLEEVTDRLAAAAKGSLSRLEPFDAVGVGSARVDRVASIRRVLTADGKLLTRWSACKDPDLRAMPEGNIDPVMKTVTLACGQKPLVRLHYYATHPQSFYGDGRACWDVPGFARQRLEEKEGIFQIYFTGCSGDVTMGKYNDGTPEARTELTERLHAGLQASVASTKLAPVDSVRWRAVPVQLPVRTDAGFGMDENRSVLADASASEAVLTRAAGRLACAMRMRDPVVLSALEIGPVRVLHLPGEPMIEFQHYARKLLPDQTVAVAGYGLGDPGYLCPASAYEQGGYEPSASMCPPEAEEILKQAIAESLGVER